MEAKNILVVDDDPAVLKALSSRCRALGVNVQTCADGLDALAMILRHPPDLVVLDVLLPAADGISVCEKMKTDIDLARIPVILLTGKSDPATIDKCRNLGARYVLKGIDTWDQLKPLLCELLHISGSSDTHGITKPKTQAESSAEPQEAPSLPKLLVVDDDAAISEAIKVRLKPYGIEVLRAFNGMQGFSIATTERPDVILADVLMPEGHGNYLLGRLKGSELTQHIPVIFLTGHTLGGQKDFALERDLLSLGAVAFLSKPLDFDQLLAELRHHITFSAAPTRAVPLP